MCLLPLLADGVLGGYGSVTPMDTRDSNWFLDRLLLARPALRLNRVADCGAGIGRVAKNLLLPRCGVVDLVEQSPRLLAAAPAYLAGAKITQFPGAGCEAGGSDTVFKMIGSAEALGLAGRVNLVNVGLQVRHISGGLIVVVSAVWQAAGQARSRAHPPSPA